jgi:hypothetical protein
MRRELVKDQAIAAIADRQGGVIARAQLAALGLGPSAIDHRVRSGRLHLVHRGVYSVGHRVVGAQGRRWAGVLACGVASVFSHASAAAAWNLRASVSGLMHVTVGPGGRARRPGIRVHRRPTLPDDEVTTLAGLAITTPARTLLDLAASGLRGRPLEAALDRSELLRLLDFADLQRLLARYPGRPGSSALVASLSRYAVGSVETRSVLEELVLVLCDNHGLPRPEVNCSIEGKCVISIGRGRGSWSRLIHTHGTARRRR